MPAQPPLKPLEPGKHPPKGTDPLSRVPAGNDAGAGVDNPKDGLASGSEGPGADPAAAGETPPALIGRKGRPSKGQSQPVLPAPPKAKGNKRGRGSVKEEDEEQLVARKDRWRAMPVRGRERLLSAQTESPSEVASHSPHLIVHGRHMPALHQCPWHSFSMVATLAGNSAPSGDTFVFPIGCASKLMRSSLPLPF